MKLLTDEIRERLLQNGRDNRRAHGLPRERGYIDHVPVVKFFTPDANAVWLLTELDPNEPDIAFGLCDLGLGFPELGYVRISELEAVRGPLRLPVERDRHFAATHPISVYARAARTAEAITECPQALAHAAVRESAEGGAV